MSYQFTELNGTKIHYELRGEGTAVTLIHAGINNLNMWDDQMEAFTAVHQTLRYDFRGWGKTPSPRGQFYDHEDLYHLLNHLGIKKTAIVGCSGGGKIGIQFALTHPEMVTALVLVGSGLDGYEWTAEGFLEKAEAMAAAYEAGKLAESAEYQTQIWVDGLNRPASQVNVEVRQRAYEMILHTLELGDSEGERLELAPPAIERLAEIQAPIRILSGQYDMPDVHAICDLIEEKCPYAEEQTILHDTAHLPNMERPSKFNHIALRFLRKQEWLATIYVILPHEKEAKVWLKENDNGCVLPHITLPGSLDDISDTHVQEQLQNTFGKIQVLYTAQYQEDKEAKTASAVLVLDNLGAHLENGRWVDQKTLQTISLANPDHKRLIEISLQEWESGKLPMQRPPWAKRGWYKQSESWIQDTLQAQGYPIIAPLETVRNWCLSYVMRAQTSNGDFFFKTVADLPLFVNEAVIVNQLAQLFPQQVLTPVAIDIEQDWMLLPALPQIVSWGATLEQRMGFIRQFVDLQKTAVAHIAVLLDSGCHDRRLNWMQTQIEPLLTAEFCHQDLTATEIADLINLIPYLQNLCAKLADGPIPQTLLHGDLHGGNVGILDGMFVFYDWTDACISHPFFDMIDIFFEKDTAVQTQLRNAYLVDWAEFAPMLQLYEIWTLAEIGAAIHHAISYWQIQSNMEPHAREDMSDMIPFWLRKILTLTKSLEEIDGS